MNNDKIKIVEGEVGVIGDPRYDGLVALAGDDVYDILIPFRANRVRLTIEVIE